MSSHVATHRILDSRHWLIRAEWLGQWLGIALTTRLSCDRSMVRPSPVKTWFKNPPFLNPTCPGGGPSHVIKGRVVSREPEISARDGLLGEGEECCGLA